MDFDDWRINEAYFSAVNARWGPFTIDCFASYVNNQVPRFYSRFYNPDPLAVDAFSQN